METSFCFPNILQEVEEHEVYLMRILYYIMTIYLQVI